MWLQNRKLRKSGGSGVSGCAGKGLGPDLTWYELHVCRLCEEEPINQLYTSQRLVNICSAHMLPSAPSRVRTDVFNVLFDIHVHNTQDSESGPETRRKKKLNKPRALFPSTEDVFCCLCCSKCNTHNLAF